MVNYARKGVTPLTIKLLNQSNTVIVKKEGYEQFEQRIPKNTTQKVVSVTLKQTGSSSSTGKTASSSKSNFELEEEDLDQVAAQMGAAVKAARSGDDADESSVAKKDAAKERACQKAAEAKAAEELSRQRYQQGLTGFLVVLETERRRRIAEEQLTVLKGQIWTTRVNLYLALGGDWDKQEEEEILAVEKNE